MSIFRINKNKNYTVMSNYHFKEKNMSLKAKGLLSLMLSLPDDWNYSIYGLVSICKENETAIKTTLKELQEFGYLKIIKLMPCKENGRTIIEYIYDIFEHPQEDKKQEVENLPLENLSVENQVQLNTNKLNTNKLNTNEFKKEKSYLSLDSKPMEENFHTPTEENFNTPMEENFQDNNTVINIKNKKEKNYKKEKNEINEQKQEYELLELKRVKETVIQKVENVSLQKKILNFLNFRIKNKKPVTIEYIRVFLEKLDKLSNFNDNEKIEILNQSIERGYTTIYAVNKKSNFNFNRYNKTISTPESYDTSEYEIMTSSEDYLDKAMDLL